MSNKMFAVKLLHRCSWCLINVLVQLYTLVCEFSQYQVKITEIEVEMRALQQAATLFEVSISEYKQLKTCRRDIGLLKSLWDSVGT